MTKADQSRKRLRRQLRWILPGLLLVLVGIVAALPRFLETARARAWMLDQANQALAPGGLEVESFRFSWVGPTRMTGFVLKAPGGKPVALAPRATWDRNLWRILFDRPNLGTLTLHNGLLDIERSPDGTIDLYEALRPILGLDPLTDLKIAFDQNQLELAAPGLIRPILADQIDGYFHITPRPRPLAWDFRLRNHSDEAGFLEEMAELRGELVRQESGDEGLPDLTVELVSKRWPLEIDPPELSAMARVDALLAVQHNQGRWESAGNVSLLEVFQFGKTWELGLTWQVEPIGSEGNLDLAVEATVIPEGVGLGSADGVVQLAAIGQFDPKAGELVLVPPPDALPGLIGFAQEGVRLSGLGQSWEDLDFEGGFVGQIEAMGRSVSIWTGLSIPDLEGLWNARCSLKSQGDGLQFVGALDLPDLSWPFEDGERWVEPVAMDWQVLYRPEAEQLDLIEGLFACRYGTGLVSGQVNGLPESAQAEFSGRVNPDWEQVNTFLADRVEPGARVGGQAIQFQGRGSLASLADDPWKAIEAGIEFEAVAADYLGLRFGPARISARLADGQILVDPIEGPLNGGRIGLLPEILRDDEGRMILRLDEGSVVQDAEVDEEVSRRVLAYVAPVLGQATRPQGLVSASVDRAEIPLFGSKEDDPGTIIEGQVLFRDVEFVPGDLSRMLLGIIGRRDAVLRLDQPVFLTIADGKVDQRGLEIPLGDLLSIELEGSVDFDRNLDMIARLPVNPTILRRNPLLARFADGKRFTVPISGTLDQPRIDESAFGENLKEMGEDLLRRGTGGLFDQLLRLPGRQDRER